MIAVFRYTLLIFMLVFLSSCAAPARNISQQELVDRFGLYVTKYKDELTAIALKSQRRLKQEYIGQGSQSYDILVLSGGGAFGAFGAGFLKGWGEIEEGEFARPDFDSVSGVSTGALIAPFAFVGTEDSYDELLKIYRNPDEQLISPRALTAFLLGKNSYFDATQLENQIRKNITSNLISSIADLSKENKTLLVGATNLDYGMMRVWDLGELAESRPIVDALQEIPTRLLASSAIPAAFPSVNIEEYLYVDGGASMQVVSGIENREWLYSETNTDLDFVHRSKPIRVRIWVVINNKLLLEPEVTSPAWPAIVKRSLFSLMNTSTLQTLQDIETFSQMINQRPEFDIQMHYVAIPQDYEIEKTSSMFDKEKMRGLADIGERMGRDRSSWEKRVLRPGAPISDQKWSLQVDGGH